MTTAAAVGREGFAGSPITDWCVTCQDYAVPMRNGTCGFCGTELGKAPAEPQVIGPPTALGDFPMGPPALLLRGRTVPPPTTRQVARREPLHYGQEGFGPVCACGGPKRKQAHQCRRCFQASGRSGGKGVPRPALRGPYGVSEDQLEEARRVYEEEQVSLREIARRIFSDTYGYSSERSLSEVLYNAFRSRGWPLRSQSDATRLRNWKHGLKQRGQTNEQQTAYRHWHAQQRGWNAVKGPGNAQCAGVRQSSPRKGQRCRRPSMDGSDYCYSHDPARKAQRDAHLEQAREKLPLEERKQMLAAARVTHETNAARVRRWRWRTVASPWPNGPRRVAHPLAHRVGDPVREVCRGSNGNALLVFDDGEWTIAPWRAAR